MATTTIDDKVLKEITDTIVRHFHPRRIILFGSHARGDVSEDDVSEDSDLDLLIEMETDKRPVDRVMEVDSKLKAHTAAMDILVYTPEEMREHREWSFFKTLEREGKLLYVRGR